jgi:hypothetical protein
MISYLKARRALVAAAALAVAVHAVAGTAAGGTTAQKGEPFVTVKLKPVAPSKTTGTVILRSIADGTRARIELRRLPGAVDALVKIHAGTRLSRLSASHTFVARLPSSPAGVATGASPVRFRHREPVALNEIADGEHSVVVSVGKRTVAFGVIPAAP